MIKNLAEYFLPEQEFYLENVIYNRLESATVGGNYTLNCIDNIEVTTNKNEGVKIQITRKLEFNPKELFELVISFGAFLKFVPEMKAEYDWSKINLAEEFRDNGEFVTANLMSRISLLTAQITSSFGQQPLILPPVVAKVIEN